MSAFSCKVFARGSALDWNRAQSSITVHGFQESMFWNLFPNQRCFQAVTVRCSCCELLHPWAHTRFPPSDHPLNPLTHSLVAPFILFFYVCLQPQTECTDAHPKNSILVGTCEWCARFCHVLGRVWFQAVDASKHHVVLGFWVFIVRFSRWYTTTADCLAKHGRAWSFVRSEKYNSAARNRREHLIEKNIFQPKFLCSCLISFVSRL